MEIGWNIKEKLLIAMNKNDFTDERYPIVQAYLNLVYFKNKDFPNLVVQFHRISPCEGDSLQPSVEHRKIMKKMRNELLKELTPTIGNTFYFIDEHSEKTLNKVYKFIHQVSELQGITLPKYRVEETELEIDKHA